MCGLVLHFKTTRLPPFSSDNVFRFNPPLLESPIDTADFLFRLFKAPPSSITWYLTTQPTRADRNTYIEILFFSRSTMPYHVIVIATGVWHSCGRPRVFNTHSSATDKANLSVSWDSTMEMVVASLTVVCSLWAVTVGSVVQPPHLVFIVADDLGKSCCFIHLLNTAWLLSGASDLFL